MGNDGCKMNQRRLPTINKTVLVQPGKILFYDNGDYGFCYVAFT